MELLQTKKTINMAEVEILASIAQEAQGNPELNWNKGYDKINRDRNSAGIPTLRYRCYIAIMKSGGAKDGRIVRWSKRDYLKRIGYKDYQLPVAEVPQQENIPVVAEIQPVVVESSSEAEDSIKLSKDACVLLNFFVNKQEVNASAATKFFGVSKKRIATALKELTTLQIIVAQSGTSGSRGCRYRISDIELVKGIYPQIGGICLKEDMTICSKKEEHKEPKTNFDPSVILPEILQLIREQCDNGIPYTSSSIFKKLFTDGCTDNQCYQIEKYLEQRKYLARVGVRGDSWFFNDPENEKIQKALRKTEIPTRETPVVPVEQEISHLTEDDDAEHEVVVNCRNKNVQYRITKTVAGFVIDIW